MAAGRLKGAWAGVALLIAALLAAGDAPGTVVPPYPRSMAVLGDSLSRAYGSSAAGDHPEHAWATGAAAADGVLSHLERLRLVQPAIAAHAYEDAVSGAHAADLPLQASQAVAQGVGYAAVLMGTNDACAPSLAAITSVAAYRASVEAALAELDRLPDVRIFIASVPDPTRLWEVLHQDPAAQQHWAALSACQDVLGPQSTPQDRAVVRDRILAFDAAIAEACARRPRCRTDGGAVTAWRFQASDVSTSDSFHLSLSGQAQLAALSWSYSWWPSLAEKPG